MKFFGYQKILFGYKSTEAKSELCFIKLYQNESICYRRYRFRRTALVQELLAHGHPVLGLARSEESVNKLNAAAVEAHRGDLNDFESLKSGAEIADAVIHSGFVHDFTRFEEICKLDGKVIETIGKALVGMDKPLLITSGTAIFSKDGITTEKDRSVNPHPRIATENAADAVSAKGVKVAVIRLSPPVHGKGDVIGFVPTPINIAKEKGIPATINDGNNFFVRVGINISTLEERVKKGNPLTI